MGGGGQNILSPPPPYWSDTPGHPFRRPTHTYAHTYAHTYTHVYVCSAGYAVYLPIRMENTAEVTPSHIMLKPIEFMP